MSILRTPVAGATPLEGPGPSGASLSPEPWDGGFPPGGFTAQLKGPSQVRVPFNNPLAPRGRGCASRRMSRPPNGFCRARRPRCGLTPQSARKSAGIPGDEGCLDTMLGIHRGIPSWGTDSLIPRVSAVFSHKGTFERPIQRVRSATSGVPGVCGTNRGVSKWDPLPKAEPAHGFASLWGWRRVSVGVFRHTGGFC